MKKNFMCFIYVYFWNRKMDNPVLIAPPTYITCAIFSLVRVTNTVSTVVGVTADVYRIYKFVIVISNNVVGNKNVKHLTHWITRGSERM